LLALVLLFLVHGTEGGCCFWVESVAGHGVLKLSRWCAVFWGVFAGRSGIELAGCSRWKAFDRVPIHRSDHRL
jgi:hypothetical protein